MADLLSSIPSTVWVFLAMLVLVIGGTIIYALHSKGDVNAEFSHGMTSFKLQAKERPQNRKAK